MLLQDFIVLVKRSNVSMYTKEPSIVDNVVLQNMGGSWLRIQGMPQGMRGKGELVRLVSSVTCLLRRKCHTNILSQVSRNLVIIFRHFSTYPHSHTHIHTQKALYSTNQGCPINTLPSTPMQSHRHTHTHTHTHFWTMFFFT